MGFLTYPHKNDLQFGGLNNTWKETCSLSKNFQICNGGEIWERNIKKEKVVLRAYFLAIMKDNFMLKREDLCYTGEIHKHNFLLYINILQPCQESVCDILERQK